ncbi:MAG: Ig-like domain-containing protein, partial [Paludibacteraceae bacterium]|nr:Ig-like domain-containing protein [Paludibacteraceae bacterium]
FAAGMTANSDTAEATFFLPHIPNGSHVFNSSDSVVWQSGGDLSAPKKTYTFSSKMKKTYHTPHIAKDGKTSFQYGSTNTAEFDTTLLFHVGDSMMRYMTPARLWSDLEAESNGYKEGYGDNYRAWVRDTMGDYFNNIDIMYLDGLSIPISSGTGKDATTKTEDDLFPEGAHVIVNIYKADSIGGKEKNKANRSEVLWTGTLTKTDFTPFKEDVRYRGALNVTFKKPLIIEGPFVVELSDMKHSGCNFYVFSDKSNNRNRWGYYVKDGVETYPDGYCLAVSVYAMFPALTQAVGDSLTVIMKSTGASAEKKNRPYRAIYSNVQYDPNSDDWDIYASEGLSIDFGIGASGDYTNWRFSMDTNKTEDIRYEEFSITFRGQNLTYTIKQAPMLKSFSFAEQEVYVEIGEQVLLEPVLVPATSDQTDFKWSTEKDAIAMVNSDGLVTGMTKGVTTITATCKTNENIKASCTVYVATGVDLEQVKENKSAKAVKSIENGQFVILRDGKRFSILGSTL